MFVILLEFVASEPFFSRSPTIINIAIIISSIYLIYKAAYAIYNYFKKKPDISTIPKGQKSRFTRKKDKYMITVSSTDSSQPKAQSSVYLSRAFLNKITETIENDVNINM